MLERKRLRTDLSCKLSENLKDKRTGMCGGSKKPFHGIGLL